MTALRRLVAPATLRRLLLPLVAALIALPIARGMRDYSWPLALVSAAAVGALAYAARRSVDQIRLASAEHRPPQVFSAARTNLAPGGVETAGRSGAPRPDEERGDEQNVDPAAGDPADQEQEEP